MNFQVKRKLFSLAVVASLSLATFLLPGKILAQTGSGVLNTSCTPGSTDECQAALYCKANADGTGTCADANPNAVQSTTPSPTLPSSDNVVCQPPLVYKNGICLPQNPNTSGIAASQTLTDLIIKVIQYLTYFAGLIAVVFIIIGGYLYMSAGGNEEQAEKGKKTIINFVLGLVVIILAYAIVTILNATLNGTLK